MCKELCCVKQLHCTCIVFAGVKVAVIAPIFAALIKGATLTPYKFFLNFMQCVVKGATYTPANMVYTCHIVLKFQENRLTAKFIQQNA